MDGGAWWAAVHWVSKSRTRLSDFTFTFHFHALKKEMATHSSVLAWRIPGTAEPGGLPSMGSHRVGHDWSNLAAAARSTQYISSTQYRIIISRHYGIYRTVVTLDLQNLFTYNLFAYNWKPVHFASVSSLSLVSNVTSWQQLDGKGAPPQGNVYIFFGTNITIPPHKLDFLWKKKTRKS